MKYYVTGQIAFLDVGAEVEAENPYMAAVIFEYNIWNDFNLDDVIVTEVEEV